MATSAAPTVCGHCHNPRSLILEHGGRFDRWSCLLCGWAVERSTEPWRQLWETDQEAERLEPLRGRGRPRMAGSAGGPR